jgi:glyoxylase-like metal-dependent hydrolase (beta-lactamase superfamily II)
MIYLARTDSGVIAVDLGWTGAERRLRRGLARLGASPADVKYVFLTHAHRDHTYGWRQVRQARFVLGTDEVPFFTGGRRYRALLPRIGDWLVTYAHPRPDEVSTVPLSRDSMFVFGDDTVFAYPVPGHTPGSMAYVVRGTLFGGDAINWRPWTGFRGARPEFSEDLARSRASLRALWNRLDMSRVRAACTAHAKCGPLTEVQRGAGAR